MLRFSGIDTGGAIIYWFTGAIHQAVTTALTGQSVHQSQHQTRWRTKPPLPIAKSKLRFVTKYAQKGMSTSPRGFLRYVAFAFVEPFFFIGYLIQLRSSVFT